MRLDQYLERILTIVGNHWIIAEIESQEIKRPVATDLYIKLKLSTIDGSPVHVREYVILTDNATKREDYTYQFRYEGEAGFLRYDNAHGVHHKHFNDEIIEQDEAPLLIAFLREVEHIILKELEG